MVCSVILDLSWPVKTPKSENLRTPSPPKNLKTNKAHNQMERTSNYTSVAARDSRVVAAQQLGARSSALHWSFLLAH